MPAIEMLTHIFRINSGLLSPKEKTLLEANYFIRLCEELLITLRREEDMLDAHFIRKLVSDILSTREYSLRGIAYYTHVPEDMIYDILSGVNTNPSLQLARKIIELHSTVKPALYHGLVKKIVEGG